MKSLIALALTVALLSGCAHSDIYVINPNGEAKRIAHFEGDMTKQSFTYRDGKLSVLWKADTVNHSAATLAQGAAAHDVLGGVATLGTATGIAIATSGALPGGLNALFHGFRIH